MYAAKIVQWLASVLISLPITFLYKTQKKTFFHFFQLNERNQFTCDSFEAVDAVEIKLVADCDLGCLANDLKGDVDFT